MKTLQFLVIALLFLTSCSKDRLDGNGHIVTEFRETTDFSKVISSGSQRVHLIYGSDYEIELRGSSNLLPRFETDVRNHTLYLGFERINVSDNDIEVFVTVPQVTSATLSGSGKIYFEGAFPFQDKLNLRLSGSGDIRAQDSFDVDELEISVSGSGDIDLRKVYANSADVRISGSGTSRTNVSDYLNAKISGSGKIYYSGDASVDTEISGSGKVIRF